MFELLACVFPHSSLIYSNTLNNAFIKSDFLPFHIVLPKLYSIGSIIESLF